MILNQKKEIRRLENNHLPRVKNLRRTMPHLKVHQENQRVKKIMNDMKLIEAVKKNDIELVKKLIKEGDPLNEKNEDGFASPVHRCGK